MSTKTGEAHSREADPKAIAELEALRRRLDPFTLSQSIQRQLTRIYALANKPSPARVNPKVRQPLPALLPGDTLKPYLTVRSRVTF